MRKYQLNTDGKTVSQAIPEDHQINREVAKKIRERYSISDELKARRVGGDYATEVDAYIAECVTWGQEQKAARQQLFDNPDGPGYLVRADDLTEAEIKLLLK